MAFFNLTLLGSQDPFKFAVCKRDDSKAGVSATPPSSTARAGDTPPPSGPPPEEGEEREGLETSPAATASSRLPEDRAEGSGRDSGMDEAIAAELEAALSRDPALIDRPPTAECKQM